MPDFVEKMVARLRERGLSRNRHFQSLSSEEGRKALKIHRHLRALEHDISDGCIAKVDKEEERVCLTLKSPMGTRVAYLTIAEFKILCTNPFVRAALGSAAEPA